MNEEFRQEISEVKDKIKDLEVDVKDLKRKLKENEDLLDKTRAQLAAAALYRTNAYSVSAVFPGAMDVKGWRYEVMRMCTQCCAFYENEESIHYKGSSLMAKLWFTSQDNMLHFINGVMTSHKTFCGHLPGAKWEYACRPSQPPETLLPVMITAYRSNEVDSPEHSDASYSDSWASVGSMSSAHTYFRLLESENVFAVIKPISCHIAHKALWPEYDNDKNNNRLYLSAELHRMFNGRMTQSGVPAYGIYFVENAGLEDVRFGETLYRLSKVIVGFEIPFEDVLSRINFKQGTCHVDGALQSFIHVDDAEKTKRYLDLKYNVTMNKWISKGIQFRHKIVLDEEIIP